MPFELGIDYGARLLGPEYAANKQFLILEATRHQYKIALSDLSGVDIKVHGNSASELIRSVRDWFYETVGKRDVAPPTVAWARFNDFITWLYQTRLTAGIPEDDVNEDIEKMSDAEYIDELRTWVTFSRS